MYWMWSTNCVLDWELHQYTMKANSVVLIGFSSQMKEEIVVQQHSKSEMNLADHGQNQD